MPERIRWAKTAEGTLPSVRMVRILSSGAHVPETFFKAMGFCSSYETKSPSGQRTPRAFSRKSRTAKYECPLKDTPLAVAFHAHASLLSPSSLVSKLKTKASVLALAATGTSTPAISLRCFCNSSAAIFVVEPDETITAFAGSIKTAHDRSFAIPAKAPAQENNAAQTTVSNLASRTIFI